MKRISEMYAFVTVDPADDTEGIVAVMAGGTWFPLVGADPDRVDSLRPHASKIAQQSGKTVRLIRFTVRSEMEVLQPDGKVKKL